MRRCDHIRSKDAKRLHFSIGDTFVLEAAQAAPRVAPLAGPTARVRFPKLFPLLSTTSVVVGRDCKCGTVTFNLATHCADEHSQLISNIYKGGFDQLNLPAIADGNRILSRTENRNHKVTLRSAALDDSFAFTRASDVIAPE
jgi:hypothetical protein